ncbi:hypothetical protein BDZ89DRAFT_1070966 [Hymenopellis radicata]|nr:hypothetical protein BDZ89DRAFT_1070966 [Hymenopellis radicata]
MPQPAPYADEHIPVGTPAFFSALLAHIEDSAYAQGLPIDSVVLQSILLCFISGDKHLLLRTSEEDVPLVLRIVTAILSSLFGLVTHKLRIRRAQSKGVFEQVNTTAFLQSLFLPGALSSSTSSLDQIIHHKAEKRRSGSRSTKRKSHRYSRSLSYTDAASILSPTSIRTDPFDDKTTINGGTGTLTSNPFSSSHALSPAFPRSHSDLTPLQSATEPITRGPLPNAIVVSGLEHASLPSQRALTRVLLDKRLIFDSHERGRSASAGDDLDGVWNLPDNFFMVYVCPHDPRERPAIHKTLLDQFAMSAAVTLTPDIRALAKHAHPQLPSPVIPVTYLPCLRKWYQRSHFPARLSLYLADIFSATRHHYEVDGSFLTARAISDAQDLARAARVLGGDPTGMQLVQDTAAYNDSRSITTAETSYTTTEADKFLDVMDGIAEGSVEVNLALPLPNNNEPQVLDVSEADIARIAPRVMSHRLRVRDSDDGVFRGAMVGATMPLREGGERTTVKDVLIQVLAEV